jgi:hypothetical protein
VTLDESWSTKGGAMKAKVGDHIHVHGLHLGDRTRTATIVEVRGADGAPPYVVRWSDDEHDRPQEHLYFPGSDAVVEHAEQP